VDSDKAAAMRTTRIEPSLEPATAPRGAHAGVPIEPRQRAGQARPLEPARRRSVAGTVLTLLLALLLLPLLAIVALRWLSPPTTSFMLQSPTQPVQYRWVPASQVADVARRAVIAAEDQKFWSHQGFDLEAIRKAQEYNRDPRHHRRGASTISQQTAKNLFLWPGGYLRKALEAGLTLALEKLWGKQRILEMYLNIAEFGPGVYGVEAASRQYFHKPAAELTPEEAARLAAVLPNPRQWSVANPGAYVRARTAWIMGQMGYGSRHTPAQEPVPPAELMPDDEDYLPRNTETDAPAALPPVVPVDESQEPAAEPAAAPPADAQPPEGPPQQARPAPEAPAPQ
jgi:monofunctional biosynthetic peptidoglycan transglycosylase